jgi:hypothetical protein
MSNGGLWYQRSEPSNSATTELAANALHDEGNILCGLPLRNLLHAVFTSHSLSQNILDTTLFSNTPIYVLQISFSYMPKAMGKVIQLYDLILEFLKKGLEEKGL